MFDLKGFRKDKKISQNDLADIFKVKQSFISQVETGKDQMPGSWIEILKEYYHISDIDKYNLPDITLTSSKIPFYDDVLSIGGADVLAEPTKVYSPAEYIDAGDWFRQATAALRHCGDSMKEYPSGCILAIKEVQDRRLIVPGKNYVIETSEYRVTKQIQLNQDKDFITAYSTNKETYADGRLIHAPFNIPWDAIRRISLVLGYVVKENGGTIISKPR